MFKYILTPLSQSLSLTEPPLAPPTQPSTKHRTSIHHSLALPCLPRRPTRSPSPKFHARPPPFPTSPSPSSRIKTFHQNPPSANSNCSNPLRNTSSSSTQFTHRRHNPLPSSLVIIKLNQKPAQHQKKLPSFHPSTLQAPSLDKPPFP